MKKKKKKLKEESDLKNTNQHQLVSENGDFTDGSQTVPARDKVGVVVHYRKKFILMTIIVH